LGGTKKTTKDEEELAKKTREDELGSIKNSGALSRRNHWGTNP
jgi:hypothetical protein